MIIISITLCYSISPINIVFFLILISILLRTWVAYQTAREFSSAAIVISFSRGIIVLFFYCRSFSNYERERSPRRKLMWIIFFISLFTFSRRKVNNLSIAVRSSLLCKEQFIKIAILAVLVAIIAINETIIDPKKALLSSY